MRLSLFWAAFFQYRFGETSLWRRSIGSDSWFTDHPQTINDPRQWEPRAIMTALIEFISGRSCSLFGYKLKHGFRIRALLKKLEYWILKLYIVPLHQAVSEPWTVWWVGMWDIGVPGKCVSPLAGLNDDRSRGSQPGSWSLIGCHCTPWCRHTRGSLCTTVICKAAWISPKFKLNWRWYLAKHSLPYWEIIAAYGKCTNKFISTASRKDS